MSKSFVLMTDVVIRKRTDADTDDHLKSEATQIGLNILANGTSMVDDFTFDTEIREIPEEWKNNRFMCKLRIFRVTATLSTDIASDFKVE